ncbi:dephospho-CoA kinase [Blattabacterium cuenoti]|uniref:dephospho-CoA kinase n=1 Tax=Blattabacterium cuenoti TaxID=1653831 RepID=UPI00163B633D|nr:dephospho-CoA kinase [Blattabacterium cuenoti]
MKYFLIGITGKMGSGKSLFSSFFKKRGISVYSSDKRGKILMNKTENIRKNIIKFFGKKSYEKNRLNTNFLSEKVFRDPIALKLLCSIVHPWVFLDFKNWILSQKKTLYFIKESAILFESGAYKNCDLIITLTSPVETMIERVMKRDNLKEDQILNRLNIQISNRNKIKHSNIIIENIQDISFLENKAKKIHKEIISKIYKKNGKRRQKN